MTLRVLAVLVVAACAQRSPPIAPIVPESDSEPSGTLDAEGYYHGRTPPFLLRIPPDAAPSRERLDDDRYAFAVAFDGDAWLLVLGSRTPEPTIAAIDDYIRSVETASQVAATARIADATLRGATLARALRWIDPEEHLEREVRVGWREPWFLVLESQAPENTAHANELAGCAASLAFID